MAKKYGQVAGEPSKISSGKVKSPASTPEDQQATLGGMPPLKTEPQINDANDPAKRGYAPGAVHGT